jgi:hypothetical protein
LPQNDKQFLTLSFAIFEGTKPPKPHIDGYEPMQQIDYNPPITGWDLALDYHVSTLLSIALIIY